MPYEFRKASHTPEQIATIESDVQSAFDLIKTDKGGIDQAGLKEFRGMEMEMGQLLVTLLNQETVTSDPTATFVDHVDSAITDDYVWQEISSSLRVVDHAYGSKPQSQRLSFSEFSMATSAHELTVEVPLVQIASGRYTPALIAQVMAQTKSRFTISRILDAVDVGVTAGADRSAKAGFTKRYTGLTQGNLDNAIDGLKDEGLTPTIFGRWLALTPIRSFAGWATLGSDAALRELETRGLVGSYHGAPIVTLSDPFNKRTNSHVLRYDRVYISSGVKGAIYMTKDLSFLDFAVVDPEAGVFRVGTRWEDGIKVWDPYLYRIITVA